MISFICSRSYFNSFFLSSPLFEKGSKPYLPLEKYNNELQVLAKFISNLTTGTKGSELPNFFKLWSLCSNINIFYIHCRNLVVEELKRSSCIKESFISCFMKQREQPPFLFFKGMNMLEKKALQRKS